MGLPPFIKPLLTNRARQRAADRWKILLHWSQDTGMDERLQPDCGARTVVRLVVMVYA